MDRTRPDNSVHGPAGISFSEPWPTPRPACLVFLSHLWVLQQGQPAPNPSPPSYPSSLAPTSPVGVPSSPQRARHSLPTAAGVSKSGSSSAPGPGQPPAPQQSPAATWPGPAGRGGLSQGQPVSSPSPEGTPLFLTSKAFPYPTTMCVPLRPDLHPAIELRSLQDCTLSSNFTSQSITYLTWPSSIGRSIYQIVQRH